MALADEELLSAQQVADLLGMALSTVIRHFADYPGVIDIGPPRHTRRKGRRTHRILRIPRSVLNRFLYERKVNHG